MTLFCKPQGFFLLLLLLFFPAHLLVKRRCLPPSKIRHRKTRRSIPGRYGARHTAQIWGPPGFGAATHSVPTTELSQFVPALVNEGTSTNCGQLLAAGFRLCSPPRTLGTRWGCPHGHSGSAPHEPSSTSSSVRAPALACSSLRVNNASSSCLSPSSRHSQTTLSSR